jgi:hypothetical protein
MGAVHTYYKSQLTKWMLLFTFIISFFVLSGYVKDASPSSKPAPETTILTKKFIALKGGISYKRAALALCKPQLSYRASIKRFNQSNRIYINRVASRYLHLKRLFLSTKSNINYLIKQQPYYTCKINTPPIGIC